MSSRVYAYSNLALAMVIVGSSVVFGKVITHSFPVFLASGLRFAIASVVIVPILLKYETGLLKFSKKDGLNMILMAFCGQFVFTLLVLLGLRYTSAIEAGIITSTSPAMMVIVTFLLFREKPAKLQVIAVSLVLAGIVSVNGLLDFTDVLMVSGHLPGNLLMVGAVFGEAFFLLMRKRISSDISNLALTGYLCFLGCIMFLPLALYQGISFDFAGVHPSAWGAMLYFGAVFTVLAYIFWFQGVSRVSGSTAGVFTAVMPVSAVILSCVFLDERFALHHAVGGVLILAALFLMALAPDHEHAGSVKNPQ